MFQAGIGNAFRQIVTVEDIVAQHQRTTIRANELAADEKSLGNTLRPVLGRVLKADTQT